MTQSRWEPTTLCSLILLGEKKGRVQGRKEGEVRRGREWTENLSSGFAQRRNLKGCLSFYMQQDGWTHPWTCAFTRFSGHLESELKSVSC